MTPNLSSCRIKSDADSGFYLTGRSAKAILLRGFALGVQKCNACCSLR